MKSNGGETSTTFSTFSIGRVNRKLIFGEDMTPEIAQSRATPNSKQTKRKKESESPVLSSRQKRRFTVSGEECQTPQKSPQAGVCYTPPMCALKKLMNSRGRSEKI